MYDNILFPTDGSEGANVALAHVRNLAETYDATVHVLHVANASYLGYETAEGPRGLVSEKYRMPETGMAGERTGDAREKAERSGMAGKSPKELAEDHRERCTALVNEAVDYLGDVDAEGVVRVGNPHDVIVGYAANNGVDIVVMGTHGRTGVDRYLLGSVTEKVVRTSDVPVVTVRKNAESETEATA